LILIRPVAIGKDFTFFLDWFGSVR
jgi:hypothetical protein